MAMNLAHHLLIRSAIDYYAVGRYAVFAGLNPTAGNLLHHAVEMCLKGALAKKGKSTDDLKSYVMVFRESGRSSRRNTPTILALSIQ